MQTSSASCEISFLYPIECNNMAQSYRLCKIAGRGGKEASSKSISIQIRDRQAEDLLSLLKVHYSSGRRVHVEDKKNDSFK